MSFVTSPHAGMTTNWVAVPGNDDEMTAQGVEVQTLRMKLSIGTFSQAWHQRHPEPMRMQGTLRFH